MRKGKVVETVSVEALEKREFSEDYTRALLVASEGFRRD
jgi:peptide/nickel transport system ATP-binding protein